MRHCSSFLLVLLYASVAHVSAKAQTASPGTKDPDALFAAALAGNGLGGDDLQPWHLKATYEILNHQNKIVATGAFEEWWAAKDKWKRSYSGSHYTGTEYYLPEGYVHVGDAWTASPWPESLIVTKVLTPIDANKSSEDDKAVHREVVERKFGKVQLRCLRVAKSKSIGYCMQPDTMMLRFSDLFGLDSAYNKMAVFQKRSIALETAIRVNDHALINIHVVSLTGLPQSEEATFTPPGPVTARSDSDPIYLDEVGLAGKKLSGEDPNYPDEAQQHRDQGLVVIGATITTLGNVENARVLEAPTGLLGVSALTAVRNWKYKPYLLNGHPREVRTTINVVDDLGR